MFRLMWCQQNRQIYGCVPFRKRIYEPIDEETYLVAAHAGFEVEVGNVHLLETERAFFLLLSSRRPPAFRRRISGGKKYTYLLVAPIRVLHTGQDMGLALQRDAGMNDWRG